LSLIEVVVFIVVLGVAFAGMLVVYNRVTQASVDPIVRKQALAIAQSLLEEIELHAYTFCDPDDANVYTATTPTVGAGGCAATVENLNTEGPESRYSTPRFDNVSDYDSFCMGPGIPACANPVITTAAGIGIPELGDYRVDVAIAQIVNGDLPNTIPVGEGLRVTVTARHLPTGTTVTLEGYRLRYAPNAP
jgi:MSHA pilin protein MshD